MPYLSACGDMPPKMKYTDPVLFKARGDEYFHNCDTAEFLGYEDNDQGIPMPKYRAKPYTLAGLCAHLGLGYDSIGRYAALTVFGEIIENWRHKIIDDLETHGLDGTRVARMTEFVLERIHKYKPPTQELDINQQQSTEIRFVE